MAETALFINAYIPNARTRADMGTAKSMRKPSIRVNVPVFNEFFDKSIS